MSEGEASASSRPVVETYTAEQLHERLRELTEQYDQWRTLQLQWRTVGRLMEEIDDVRWLLGEPEDSVE